MIRITLTIDTDGESSAATALRHAADRIEEGYVEVDLRNEDTPEGSVQVEKLCEYCDGTGEITEGQHDDITTKKCFNCNGPDYDAMREGK